jgi:hypothetical protein
MGETVSKESNGSVETDSGTSAETSGTSGTSGNTSTETTTTTKRKRGRPRKSETAKSAETTPKLVMVDVPGADDTEKSEKKTKKSTKKKSTKKAAQVDSTQIQMILLTISGIVASRPGMEVWNLTADEAKQIADPLANILQKSEAVANVTSEYADAIALVTACVMIFVPKFLLWQATKPKKPKNGEKINYGTQQLARSTNETRKNPGSDSTANRRTTNGKPNATQNFNGQLSAIIAPIAGI